MIGLAMQTWPDDALRRVVDAPVEKWATGGSDWYSHDARPKPFAGCLLHIAGRDREDWFDAGARLLDGPVQTLFGMRFDSLCIRRGVPRVVRLIKLRALAILLVRHPLDSKLAVLRAEVSP